MKQLDVGNIPEVKSNQGLLQLFQSARSKYVTWGFRQGHRFCKHRAHRIYKEAGMSLHRIPRKGHLERKVAFYSTRQTHPKSIH